MSTLKRTLSLFVAVLVMMAPGRAATCEVSTSGTAFGAYESIRAGDRDTSGTLSVTCSGVPGEAVSYSIQLSAGGGTYTNRKLSGPGTALSYNLYTDGARSQIWGDGSNGTSIVTDSYTLSVSPTTRSYTIYGRIPGGQTQAVASMYSDSIVVTLAY